MLELLLDDGLTIINYAYLINGMYIIRELLITHSLDFLFMCVHAFVANLVLLMPFLSAWRWTQILIHFISFVCS